MAALKSVSPAAGTTILYYAKTTFVATFDSAPDSSAALTPIRVLNSSGNWIGSMGHWEEFSGNTASVSVNPSEIPLNDGYTAEDVAKLLVGFNIGGTIYGESEYPLVRYTACGAPTACKLSETISHNNVSLSWSGATAGTANAVTGYEIQRAESTNGSTWGEWAACPNGITTATSLKVSPPATYGNYYRYRVRTRGAAGADYYSAWKVCTNTLRRDHAPLAGFTDSPLVAGATPVKALHMTELQSRVNTLRAFYGLSAYAFSPIDARGIAGWMDHVKEIRAALDAIGKSHEAWLDIPVNCPRADVINQLRAVVLAT